MPSFPLDSGIHGASPAARTHSSGLKVTGSIDALAEAITGATGTGALLMSFGRDEGGIPFETEPADVCTSALFVEGPTSRGGCTPPLN